MIFNTVEKTIALYFLFIFTFNIGAYGQQEDQVNFSEEA